jgi:hypothetical protein
MIAQTYSGKQNFSDSSPQVKIGIFLDTAHFQNVTAVRKVMVALWV